MIYYIHIAREGFRETPIHLYEWLAAARQCEELMVEEQKNWIGKPSHIVALKGDQSAVLRLDPDGLIRAEAPSKALIPVMFQLADALKAGVYSNSLRRCQTVDVCERRARNYRWRSVGLLANLRRFMKKQRKFVSSGDFVTWAVIVTLIVVICLIVIFSSDLNLSGSRARR